MKLLKTFTNIFVSTFKSMDKFEKPVQLNFKGQKSSKSALGGFISLFILGFLGYQAIFQTFDMIHRQSQKVVQTNEFHNDPSGIHLSKSNNFAFLFASVLGGRFVNIDQNSTLSFNISLHQHRSTTDGKKLQIVSQVLFDRCNSSTFPTGLFSSNTFETYLLDYAYCATAIDYTDPSTGTCPIYIQKDFPGCLTPPDLKVQGTFFSSSYDYIEFEVKLCDTNDTSLVNRAACSPNAERDILAAQGITVYLGYSNNYIDPANYSSPNQTFLDFIDWNLNPQVSRDATIQIDSEVVEDYDNLLFAESKNVQTFHSISADKMREEQLPPRGYLLQATLQRSKLTRITSRTYTKVFDVVSRIGGLSEALFLIGSVLALGYAKYRYFMIISNELYDFEFPQQKIYLKKSGIDIVSNSVADDKEKKNPVSDRSSGALTARKSIKGNVNIKDYFDSMGKKKKLEYGEFSYFMDIFRSLFRIKHPHKNLAEIAKKKVSEDLDISNIIQKLKDLDKLKMLLLNKSQLEAFNFIKKPKITLGNKSHLHKKRTPPLASITSPKDGKRTSDFLSIFDEEQFVKYKKVYEAYRQIKEDNDDGNTKLNEKILNMMDEELINLFAQVENKNESVDESKHFEQIIEGMENEEDSPNKPEVKSCDTKLQNV